MVFTASIPSKTVKAIGTQCRTGYDFTGIVKMEQSHYGLGGTPVQRMMAPRSRVRGMKIEPRTNGALA